MSICILILVTIDTALAMRALTTTTGTFRFSRCLCAVMGFYQLISKRNNRDAIRDGGASLVDFPGFLELFIIIRDTETRTVMRKIQTKEDRAKDN